MTDTAQTTRRPRERARSGAGTAGRKPAAKPMETVQCVDPVGLTGERRAAGALTLTLPMITLEFRPPRVGGREVGRVVGAARAFLPALPPRERLAYYGGLGALAAFGLIEWPVAAAIGVGTVIARRSRNGGGENLRAPV
ncbi:hypothetical protein HS048_23260 [Planomonospora sp. ID91781]|uniref:Uncharacterized protein n=1 Tax=Planomonospora sphaerica TaxID=161355 RepID=A0A171CWQ7_9ACTN|nr:MULTISPECIES: hypothetical protein [Planomonospora]MBG0823642.1 hypothetical protein [Planomonospora sp. ID91781]GAT67339.1 hypothetical protein PS9374_02992 [Planomonospora sphaerica]